MAKTKGMRAKKGSGNRKATPRTRPATVRAAPPLDPAAAAYAKLLADPCGAPLVKGISGGTNGAVVIRTEADAILGTGAGATTGAGIWIPSLGRAYFASAASDAVAMVFVENSSVAAGSGFLASQASAWRSVAGCLQLMYAGAESTRSGVVSLGVVPSSAITAFLPATIGGAALGVTTAQLRVLCQNTTRTPLEVFEVKWRPGQADGNLTDGAAVAANLTQSLLNAKGTNAILFTWTGLPAATGMRIRSVAAYEYEPNAGNGLCASVETPSSRNNPNDVLRYLDNASPGWWQRAGAVAISGLRQMANAYSGGATEAMISALYPSNRSVRAIAYNA